MTKTKTTKTKSTFNNLYQINVNEHTEKKGGLTYLTWSWAWAKVKEIHPTATYTYYKHPETNLPFSFQEKVGAFCHTSVTIMMKHLRCGYQLWVCLLYTSPSPRDRQKSRMPSSA